MPPGSPGTYRKKSASVELPAALQQLPRPHRGSVCGDAKMAEDKPWPNTKDDYELREVIGKPCRRPSPPSRIQASAGGTTRGEIAGERPQKGENRAAWLSVPRSAPPGTDVFWCECQVCVCHFTV